MEASRSAPRADDDLEPAFTDTPRAVFPSCRDVRVAAFPDLIGETGT